MIKTIDEALKVLNERNFKEKEWRFGEDPCYVVSVNRFGLITVYEHDDAIAFARQINGDYDALEAENRRLREAAAHFFHCRECAEDGTCSEGLPLAIEAGLVVEEEKPSGDNGESAQSRMEG